MSTTDTTATPEETVVARPPAGAASPTVTGNCPNCGSPMYGEFCFACGQPKKGLIRHFSTIVGDFMDSVLNVDNRILRTVVPLFVKPGYLTIDYLDGKRARYVTPLRLYFFLSVIAFLLIGAWSGGDWTIDDNGVRIEDEASPRDMAAMRERARERAAENAARATAPVDPDDIRAQVQRDIARAALERDAAIAAAAAKNPTPAPAATETAPTGPADASQAKPDAAARPDAAAPPDASAPTDARRAADAKPDDAAAPGIKTDDDKPDEAPTLNLNGRTWDRKDNPLVVSWLPQFANDALNDEIGEIAAKLGDIKRDPKPFVRQMFSSAPQALFVILPLFALMLKLFYVFKRRLYMEHLIVALHSHSFLCLAIIAIVTMEMIRSRLAPGFFNGLLGWTVGITWAWMPLYLLIMQKRVYRQGWIMTVIKYCCIGTAYLFLLVFGMMLTMLISLILL